MTFHQIQNEKISFFVPIFFLDPNINLKKIDQIFSFGDIIGYGNSCIGYFFANSKIFSFHAFLHDGAGSVKSTTYKGPGYCCFT